MKLVSIAKRIWNNPSEAIVVKRYFTLWSLFAQVVLYRSRYIDKKLLTQIVSVGGFYFTFVFPKELYIKLKEHTYSIKGYELVVIDVITHHLPYMLECGRGIEYEGYAKMRTMAFVGLYLCTTNVMSVYGIRKGDVKRLVAINMAIALFNL